MRFVDPDFVPVRTLYASSRTNFDFCTVEVPGANDDVLINLATLLTRKENRSSISLYSRSLKIGSRGLPR